MNLCPVLVFDPATVPDPIHMELSLFIPIILTSSSTAVIPTTTSRGCHLYNKCKYGLAWPAWLIFWSMWLFVWGGQAHRADLSVENQFNWMFGTWRLGEQNNVLMTQFLQLLIGSDIHEKKIIHFLKISHTFTAAVEFTWVSASSFCHPCNQKMWHRAVSFAPMSQPQGLVVDFQ